MFMKRIFVTVFLFTVLATPARASFEQAEAAYDRNDYAAALGEWRPLAEQGFASAQYNLGLMYATGQGVPQDAAKAVNWYGKAARQGDSSAQDSKLS